MKTLKVCFIATLIACLVIVGCAFATPAHADTYALTTVVYQIDAIEDTVTCIDFNGHLWKFEGVEDWEIGDIASLLMDDLNTNMIRDDKILDVFYGGWLPGDMLVRWFAQ